ncbi:DUF2063 domain-containing protein [Roseibium aquae]|uniref:DUF2063 domain-containing protein n=1 Tax=Roseibium aquae TaxID=1323746 RepID=A0A916T6Y1_9HYPH|nr:putative DNA-binding domain-containing protein [Roseibium aquae]GGB32271.1 DUF2063 domain-containing protein [Roseibium aquae]
MRVDPKAPAARDFAEGLLFPGHPVPAGVVGPDGAPDLKRFNVYRNNVIASLTDALAATYPAVRRLLGETYFSALAREFIRAHPPRSPVLIWFGQAFPGFMETFPPLAGYPYLGDVARAEWFWLQAYHAADVAPLDPALLQAVPSDGLGLVRFQPHPAASVVRSRFPVHCLLQANRFLAGQEVDVDMTQSQDVLISRPDVDVLVVRLKPGGAVFTQALLDGVALEQAAQQASETTEGFSLAPCLRDVLASGALAHMNR